MIEYLKELKSLKNILNNKKDLIKYLKELKSLKIILNIQIIIKIIKYYIK